MNVHYNTRYTYIHEKKNNIGNDFQQKGQEYYMATIAIYTYIHLYTRKACVAYIGCICVFSYNNTSIIRFKFAYNPF